MKIARFAVAALLLGWTVHAVGAAIDSFKFDTPQQEARFKQLSTELRCLVCQNQSIADSNADLAQDLRREVYQMIKGGQSDEQIVTFLVDRYGDFVLYRPPVKPHTVVLWIAPFVLILLGLFILIRFIRARVAVTGGDDADLDPDERARLERLLDNPTDSPKA